MKPMLSSQGVGMTFATKRGPFVALRDITLEVQRGESDDDLLPVQATYKLRLRPLTPPPPIPHALRLSAVIEARPVSLAETAYRRLLSVLYRESGF